VRAALLLLVCAAAAGSAFVIVQAAQQQPPPFRTTSQTVAVYVTVRERSGRLVPDLPRDAFELYDNGQKVDIAVFSSDIKPFTTALLLDMSSSMVSQYRRVVDAAKHFVGVLREDDRVRIGTFGREVAISPLLTGDKATLFRILDDEVWPGGATPLWRGATAAMDSLASETGRRVILALTDGVDSGFDHNCAPLTSDPYVRAGACPGLADVRRRAIADDFMFYAIGFEGTGLDQGLREIADGSGGGHFRLEKNAELEAAFDRVADELHHQYLLGFSPVALDGLVHRIEVRLTRSGLVAKSRTSYVAVRVR
jgi:Ca-activated chloride channel family protein